MQSAIWILQGLGRSTAGFALPGQNQLCFGRWLIQPGDVGHHLKAQALVFE